jgi:ABC-2 type transport system ATP-binding protein
MMTAAIELRNVTKRFGRHTAVNALDLTVPAGSIYGFIGPNGSGKTTTLRMILRIFQPDSGEVIVLGQPQGAVADDRLGYLPEERGLYKRMRVRDILTYYARLKGLRNCRPEIDQWLIRLGAVEWSNRRVDALSKGMAQKVQFIAAVVARPQLVILDEPFSGLDPVNMESLRDAVLSLRRQGTTVVFSTHDMDMAERMCDTIFMIFRGQKVLDGTLESIQSQYAANRLRVRFANGGAIPDLKGWAGVDDLQATGRQIDFRIDRADRTQDILRRLVAEGPVEHFEIVKPSLHDIFVRIAAPERSPMLEHEGA